MVVTRDPVEHLASDRRALIDHVIKEFAKQGGQVILPDGIAYATAALLDSLDVPAVLHAVSNPRNPLHLARFVHGSLPAQPGQKTVPGHRSKQSSMDNDLNIPNFQLNAPRRKTDVTNPFNTPGSVTDVSGGGAATSSYLSSSTGAGRTSGGGGMGRPPRDGSQLGATVLRYTQVPAQPSRPSTSYIDSESEVDASTQLQLPLLETGLSDSRLNELAYLMFAAACPAPKAAPTAYASAYPAVPGGPASRGPTSGGGAEAGGGGLLGVLARQLGISEALMKDVGSVMRHVSTGHWTVSRRCSLEGLLALVAHTRPHDFDVLSGGSTSFKSWVRWRTAMADVLTAAAQLKHAALREGPASKSLLARLRGALRRVDVRFPDEFDESEYQEGVAAVTDAMRGLAFAGLQPTGSGSIGGGDAGHMPTAYTNRSGANGWATFDASPGNPFASLGAHGLPALAPGPVGSGDAGAGVGSGWQLPWALRARVAEVLLSALFDSSSGGTYIHEMPSIQAVLESSVWPALNISPALVQSLTTWTHFRQYISTGQPLLARQLKHFVSQLSVTVSATRRQLSHRANSTPRAGQTPGGFKPLTHDDEGEADSQVAAEVGRLVVDHLHQRLADYHAAFPPGNEAALQVMLDTYVSAARARGDDEEQLEGTLVSVVQSAVGAQWRRCMEASLTGAEPDTVETSLMSAVSRAAEVAAAESATYQPCFSGFMPQQHAVVAASLHAKVGEQLMPWMRAGVKLDPASANLLAAALQLNLQFSQTVGQARQQLAGRQGSGGGSSTGGGAAGASATTSIRSVLSGFRAWELDVPIQQAMDKWVVARVEKMFTWVDRQLASERWTPVSSHSLYCQSCVAVIQMISETLDALLGMPLPVGRLPLTNLLAGVDKVLSKFAFYIRDRLGSPARLIPPMPPVTRYKKPFVVKQEEVEEELQAAATGLAPRLKNKGTLNVLKEKMSRSFLAATSAATRPGGQGGPGTDEPKGFLESVPPISQHKEYNELKALTPITLACYIMSAYHVSQNLAQLINQVTTKWTPSHDTSRDASWVPACFSGCQKNLNTVCHAVCVFMATKVVFWDMRYQWLEQLYRHHVPSRTDNSVLPPPFSCRIELLLDTLHRALGDACSNMPDGLRTQVATELLTAAATAWQRVLLDGGPCRWFIPDDVPALSQDLDALRDLFESEGDGLPRAVAERILWPCRRLLILVGTDLATLIKLLTAARTQGSVQLQGEVFDEGVLMRTLARRPDRMASKALKEKYKMHRRVKQ